MIENVDQESEVRILVLWQYSIRADSSLLAIYFAYSIRCKVELLRGYAPGLPSQLLYQLTSAFAELRSLNSEALVAYPFSMRELVFSVSFFLQIFTRYF